MLDDRQRKGLRRLYRDLDHEVKRAAPRCEVSGLCCRFSDYGHVLFVSEMEGDLLVEPGLPAGRPIDAHSCPYQVNGLCSARDRRPLGCRVFFCDPAYAERQVELSERYLRRLKELHGQTRREWNYRPLHDILGRWAARIDGGSGGATSCLSSELA